MFPVFHNKHCHEICYLVTHLKPFLQLKPIGFIEMVKLLLMKLQIKALKKLRRLIISHYWMKCGLIPAIVLIFIPSNMRKLYKKAISLLLLWKLFLIPKACSSLLVRILIFLHLQISFEKCKYYYEIRKTRKGSLFIVDFIKNVSKLEAATKKRPWEYFLDFSQNNNVIE